MIALASWLLSGSWLVVAAYLGIWLARGGSMLMQIFIRRRGVTGRLAQIGTDGNAPRQDDAWLCLAGLSLGAVLMVALGRFAPALAEYGMLIGLIVSLALEEFRTPPGLDALPAVIALLSACRSTQEQSIVLALDGLAESLPSGAVRAALAKALRSRRAGEPVEVSLGKLASISPYLDEFVAEARYAGWQTGPTLNVVLEPTIRKAMAEWERTTKLRRFFEQAETSLLLARAAAVGGLAFAWLGADKPIFDGIILAFSMVVSLGVGLYLALSRAILRRGLLLAALMCLGLWWAIPPGAAPVQVLEPSSTPTWVMQPYRTKAATLTIRIVTATPTSPIIQPTRAMTVRPTERASQPPNDDVTPTPPAPRITPPTATPPVLPTATPPVLPTDVPPVPATATPPTLPTAIPSAPPTSTPPTLPTDEPPIPATATPPALPTDTPPGEDPPTEDPPQPTATAPELPGESPTPPVLPGG